MPPILWKFASPPLLLLASVFSLLMDSIQLFYDVVPDKEQWFSLSLISFVSVELSFAHSSTVVADIRWRQTNVLQLSKNWLFEISWDILPPTSNSWANRNYNYMNKALSIHFKCLRCKVQTLIIQIVGYGPVGNWQCNLVFLLSSARALLRRTVCNCR